MDNKKNHMKKFLSGKITSRGQPSVYLVKSKTKIRGKFVPIIVGTRSLASAKREFAYIKKSPKYYRNAEIVHARTGKLVRIRTNSMRSKPRGVYMFGMRVA